MCAQKPQASLGKSCLAMSSASASATAEKGKTKWKNEAEDPGERNVAHSTQGRGPWRAYCCTLNTGGEEVDGRKGGQLGLLLNFVWQGARRQLRRRERKEEEEKDNEAEDPGERTVAHSTQGERTETEEGRTSRPTAPPDCAPVVQTKNEHTSLSAS